MGVEMVRPEAEDAVNTLPSGWHRVARASVLSQLDGLRRDQRQTLNSCGPE